MKKKWLVGYNRGVGKKDKPQTKEKAITSLLFLLPPPSPCGKRLLGLRLPFQLL
jgi:hypothetical protein